MVSVKFIPVFALFAVVHVNGCSVDVEVTYDDNGGAPVPSCQQNCNDDEPGKVPTYFSGDSYKKFPELTESYNLMVAVHYVKGVFRGCSLVPYMSEEEMRCYDGEGPCPTDCPDDFTNVGDHCYLVSPKKTSKKKGIEYCASVNAVPAIIESQEQMDLLADFLTVSVYLGINDIEVEGDFRNPGQDSIPYLNFNGGEPNNIGNEDCVVAKDNRKHRWNDVRCWKRFNTLCQLQHTEIPQGEPGKQCSLGIKYDDSTCFYPVEINGTYNEAIQFCESTGMALASIESEAEQTFVASILRWDTWIGLQDRVTDGDFIWVNGAPFNYTSWYYYEPNTFMGNEEDCVELVMDYGYNWNDNGCDKDRQYLCRGSPDI